MLTPIRFHPTMSQADLINALNQNFAEMESQSAHADTIRNVGFLVHKGSSQNVGTISPSDITFETVIHDTHDAFDGTWFTAPFDGYYHFDAGVEIELSNAVRGLNAYVTVTYEDATTLQVCRGGYYDDNISQNYGSVNVSGEVYLKKGERARVRAQGTVSAGTPVALAGAFNYFSGRLVATE